MILFILFSSIFILFFIGYFIINFCPTNILKFCLIAYRIILCVFFIKYSYFFIFLHFFIVRFLLYFNPGHLNDIHVYSINTCRILIILKGDISIDLWLCAFILWWV